MLGWGRRLAAESFRAVVISDRAGSLGEHDLYLSTRASTAGTWAQPVAMAALNTGEQEASPWLSTSTLLLYYASSRQQNNHDIWLSTRPTTNVPFGGPVHVPSLSSSASDEDPWLSPDLRTVYFSSTRDGGDNDIFVAQR